MPVAPGAVLPPAPASPPAPSGLPGALGWLDTAKDYGERYNVPPEYILPLIQAESGGNPQAVGDNGASVGLFQLHERGVGYGLTVEERYNPQLQFDRMMPRIKAAYDQGRARGLQGRALAEFVGGQAEVSVPESHYRYGDAYDWISEYLAQIMAPIDNSIIGDQAG